MNPIPAATARLQAAADLAEILGAACEAFELMLRVIEGQQDPSGGAFADLVIASTYAANGRDALLFAPALPAVSGNRVSVAESESALETVVELRQLCDVLADRLDDAAAAPASQADAEACAEGKRQAIRLGSLLAGLIDP